MSRVEPETSREQPETSQLEPTGYVKCPAPGCGKVIKEQGKYAHFSNSHKELDYDEYKDKFEIAEKPKQEGVEEEKGIPPPSVEALSFVVDYLSERLDSVYGISDKLVDPIVKTVEDNPQIALNPTALFWHIKQLAGKANDYQLYLFISGLFNKLRDEGLLSSSTLMPVLGMPNQLEQSQPFPFMFPQSQSGQFSPFASYPSAPHTPPREEFEDYSERKLAAKRRERREEEEHAARMAKLTAELENLTKPKTESTGKSNIIEVVEPMRDAEGNLLKDPEGKIVFRKITGPGDQVRGASEDPELVFLTKLEKYKKVLGPNLDETKVRELIRAEKPQATEAITKEDVEKAAKDVAKTVLTAKEEEDKAERRHQETLQAIRDSSGSQFVDGYKDDRYRFLGQGMNRLATVIDHKQPIKLIVDMVRETPPGKEVEAEAREGIFKRVSDKFVAEE